MQQTRRGFTIIELLIVIVILVALVMITIFAFGNYRQRTAKTEVRTELMNGAGAVTQYKNFNNTVPTSQAAFDALYKAGSNVTLTYTYTSASVYCLKGQSTAETSVVWYINGTRGQPSQTAC